MDEEWEKRRTRPRCCKDEPSDYIKNGRVLLRLRARGEDAARSPPSGSARTQLLYASDYPHWDSDWPHTREDRPRPHRHDATQLKRKVLAENALRFYGLKAAVPA